MTSAHLRHRWIQALILILCLESCTTLPPVPESVSKHGDKIPWDRSMVEGMCLHRENEDGYEFLKFGPRGIVLVTAGQRNGPSVAPVSGWRLHHGRLFHSNADGDYLGEEIHLVSLPEGELRLRGADGEFLPYQVSMPEKKPRMLKTKK